MEIRFGMKSGLLKFVSFLYFCKVPRFAVSFVDVLKPLAPPNFRETVYAFGFDKKEWTAELRKKVRPDQLTPEFGGTKLTGNSI